LHLEQVCAVSGFCVPQFGQNTSAPPSGRDRARAKGEALPHRTSASAQNRALGEHSGSRSHLSRDSWSRTPRGATLCLPALIRRPAPPPLDTCARSQLGLRRFFGCFFAFSARARCGLQPRSKRGPQRPASSLFLPRPPFALTSARPQKDCPTRCPSLSAPN